LNATLNRLGQLEARFERMRLDLQDCQRKLTQALQQIRDGQAKYTPSNGSGACTVYQVPGGLVIPAGGSATANVYALSGGTSTLVATGATVYNTYAVATTSGKPLTVGANGDGSFTVIGQSC
jgi:hypothetical protein